MYHITAQKRSETLIAVGVQSLRDHCIGIGRNANITVSRGRTPESFIMEVDYPHSYTLNFHDAPTAFSVLHWLRANGYMASIRKDNEPTTE